MKKIFITLVASIWLAGSALAGQVGVGVTGSIAAIAGSGTESDKDGATDLNGESSTSVRTANASNNAFIGSIFAEYQFDNGFTLGIDTIPGSADVNSKKLTRTDVTVDANEATQDDGDNTAQAEVENIMTVYAEIPLHAGLYFKGGYTEMDVNTLESGGAGNYSNTSVDGMLYGLGYRNTFGSNGFYKVEGSHTEFDSITLNSSTTDSGNRIKADLDVTRVTLAVGYAF